jgi:two-component system OmpR family response regulator
MRVLLIEDEPELLRVLARALREEGYAVDEAADGEEGLFKATGCDYDAVVLDLMLPRRSGWEVLAAVRRERKTPVLILSSGWEVLAAVRRERKTPVLILTARDGIADRVRGLDSGADDYLVKPFQLAELLARLRALIRRAAGLAEPVIVVRDVAVDPRARAVTRGGEPVALTAREYALVELLALNRGRLVSRTQIYDHLFDENEDSLSNLVEVHVSNIRKKLGKDFIVTRRGQGYMIDA